MGGACEQGDEQGCYNLARMYLNGEGVDADLPHALELYRKACTLGHQPSCEEAARITGDH